MKQLGEFVAGILVHVSWAGVAPLPLESASVSEPWPIRRPTISEIEGGFFMIALWRVPYSSWRACWIAFACGFAAGVGSASAGGWRRARVVLGRDQLRDHTRFFLAQRERQVRGANYR